MNVFKLAWKNLLYKPANLMLSLSLFALGVGLISILFLVKKQVQEKFDSNLAGVNLVLGAKGSPLQLILCNMFHIDSPTGNISIKEIAPFLNPKHPIIKTAVPLSLGDSYEGYRIVGTNEKFASLYKTEIAEGNLWKADFEASIGADVASRLGIGLGHQFKSSHGLVHDDNLIHEDSKSFEVKGIFEKTGTVVDQLILTNAQSIWAVHDNHSHAEHEGQHEGHSHGEEESEHDGHDHGEAHSHEGHDHSNHKVAHQPQTNLPKSMGSITDYPDKEITALLLQFKGTNIQSLNMARSINENTDMLAASPVMEINRLYDMMGVGEDALRNLGLIIVLVSGFSIFISLFNSLKERKYELSLMRVMGATRLRLFTLIICEGLIIAILGYLLGILLSHIGMTIFSGQLEEAYRYKFNGWQFLKEEGYLFFGALLIGLFASIIPAIQAYRSDISNTLTVS